MRRIGLAAIAVALAALIMAVVSLCGSAPRVDAREVLSRAILGEGAGSYLAQIRTSAPYGGKTVESTATVYHQGHNERIEYSGPPSGAVWSLTKGRFTYTYLPKQKLVVEGKADTRLSDQRRMEILFANYEPKVESMEDVAGHEAYVLVLRPRRDGGPAKRMWIDREHSVVLKSIDYTASGRERSRMEVTQISYGVRIDPTKFEPGKVAGSRRIRIFEPSSEESLSTELGIVVKRPARVPRGYVLEGCYLFNCQCGCDHSAAQLTYTDGLNSLSVFQTRTGAHCESGSCAQSGHGCMLQESEIARLGQVERGGKTIVVVADLPADEVRQVAESVP